MTNKEAIDIIKQLPLVRHEELTGTTSDMGEALDIAIKALEQQSSDGCEGCKYMDLSEYREPCLSCKNNYILKWEADK